MLPVLELRLEGFPELVLSLLSLQQGGGEAGWDLGSRGHQTPTPTDTGGGVTVSGCLVVVVVVMTR